MVCHVLPCDIDIRISQLQFSSVATWLLPKYDRQYSRPARLINNNNNIITVDREISKKLLISIIFTFTTFRNLGNPENSHVHETYIPTGLVCQVMSNNDIYSVKYVQTVNKKDQTFAHDLTSP